jgi:hypothetical protein
LALTIDTNQLTQCTKARSGDRKISLANTRICCMFDQLLEQMLPGRKRCIARRYRVQPTHLSWFFDILKQETKPPSSVRAERQLPALCRPSLAEDGAACFSIPFHPCYPCPSVVHPSIRPNSRGFAGKLSIPIWDEKENFKNGMLPRQPLARALLGRSSQTALEKSNLCHLSFLM